MPGKIEVNFSDFCTIQIGSGFLLLKNPVLPIVPICTAQHIRGLYGYTHTSGQRFKLWPSSLESAVILRHGHTVRGHQAWLRQLQRVQGSLTLLTPRFPSQALEKWKHLRVQHAINVYIILEEDQIWESKHFIFIQHTKPVYRTKRIRIRKKCSELRKMKMFWKALKINYC